LTSLVEQKFPVVWASYLPFPFPSIFLCSPGSPLPMQLHCEKQCGLPSPFRPFLTLHYVFAAHICVYRHLLISTAPQGISGQGPHPVGTCPSRGKAPAVKRTKSTVATRQQESKWLSVGGRGFAADPAGELAAPPPHTHQLD